MNRLTYTPTMSRKLYFSFSLSTFTHPCLGVLSKSKVCISGSLENSLNKKHTSDKYLEGSS